MLLIMHSVSWLLIGLVWQKQWIHFFTTRWSHTEWKCWLFVQVSTKCLPSLPIYSTCAACGWFLKKSDCFWFCSSAPPIAAKPQCHDSRKSCYRFQWSPFALWKSRQCFWGSHVWQCIPYRVWALHHQHFLAVFCSDYPANGSIGLLWQEMTDFLWNLICLCLQFLRYHFVKHSKLGDITVSFQSVRILLHKTNARN